MLRIALIITFTTIFGCSSIQENTATKENTPKLEDEVSRLRNMDKQHFIDTISIKDDQFETHAAFSTRDGFIQYWPPHNNIKSDAFLRGYINKRTQSKSFAVYVKLEHYTGDWLHPYQSNYGRPLRTSRADKIDSSVDCGRHCHYTEEIIFDVDEEELRRMKTLSTEDIATKSWMFKLKTKSGMDIIEGFNVNEILALLDVIDNYKVIPMLK